MVDDIGEKVRCREVLLVSEKLIFRYSCVWDLLQLDYGTSCQRLYPSKHHVVMSLWG